MRYFSRAFQISVLIGAALVLSACAESPVPFLPTPGVPFVHKIDIQQGNVVTQEMVAQLRLGMNKKKVRFVMGTPIIADTFHSSRWDYIYTFHEGGGSTERRLVTVVFNEDGKLINVEGNVKPALGTLVVDKHQDMSVNVPGEYEKGFLNRIKDSMPFTGDDDESEDEVSAAESDDGGEDGDLIADAESSVNSVTVPEGRAPKKKKGFFRRIVDSMGLGAEHDDDGESTYDPGDPKYRDPTDPDNQ